MLSSEKKIEILEKLSSFFSIDEMLNYFFQEIDLIGSFQGKMVYFLEEENKNYLRSYKSQFNEKFKEMENISYKALLPIQYYQKIQQCLWSKNIEEIRKDLIETYDVLTQNRIKLWDMDHIVYFPIYSDQKDIIGILILFQSGCYLEKKVMNEVNDLVQLFYYPIKYSKKISKIIANESEVKSVKYKYTKLMNLAKQINVLVEPEKLYETIIMELLNIFDFQLGFVQLEKENFLQIEYGIGVDEEAQKLFLKLKDYFGNPSTCYQILPLMNPNCGAVCLAFVNKTHFYFYDIENLYKMPMSDKDRIALNIAGEDLKSLIQIPIYNKEKTYGIFQLWSLKKNKVLTEADIEMIANICSYIPSILKNAEIHSILEIQKNEVEEKNKMIQLRNKEMMDELRLARQIQQSLIPKDAPDLPGAKIAVLYKPMDQIGGDFYDFITFRDSNHLGIFVSDVSGNGVAAALITTMLKSIIETADEHKKTPVGFLEYINEKICGQTNRNVIMAFYGIYDPDTKEFKYARGSDNYPVLIREGKISELKSRGKILGVTPNLYFEEKTLLLKRNDKLLFYTDGLTKTINPDNQDFSGKFNKVMNNMSGKPIHDLIASIYIELIKHSGKYDFDDDICVVGLEIE